MFFGYAACAVTSVFLGLAVGAAPTPPPAPSAGVADWGFAGLGQRLRGLKDLFEQISPDLRITYIVLVLATFTSFMFPLNAESTNDARGAPRTESFSVQSPGFSYGSDFNTSVLRMLRIYRTGADLGDAENTEISHIAEAIQYRRLDQRM